MVPHEQNTDPKKKVFAPEDLPSILNDLLLKIHKSFDRPGGSFPIFTISSHPTLSTPTAVDQLFNDATFWYDLPFNLSS